MSLRYDRYYLTYYLRMLTHNQFRDPLEALARYLLEVSAIELSINTRMLIIHGVSYLELLCRARCCT